MSCSILSKSPQPQASPAESQESSRASSRDLSEGSAQEAGLDRHDSAFRREGLRQEAEDALTSLPCCEDLPDGAAAKSPFSSWDLEEELLEVPARTASKSAARGQSGPRSMRTADSVPQGPGAPPAVTVSADRAVLEPRLIRKSLSADTDALLEQGHTLREHLRAALVRHPVTPTLAQAYGFGPSRSGRQEAQVYQLQTSSPK